MQCNLLTLRSCIFTWHTQCFHWNFKIWFLFCLFVFVFGCVFLFVCFVFAFPNFILWLILKLCYYFWALPVHVVPLGAALAPATAAVAANEKQTKRVSFLVSATKSEAAQKCFYLNHHIECFCLFSWLEVLLPFSLFCWSEKMMGVKVSNGGMRVDVLEKKKKEYWKIYRSPKI